MLFKCKIAWNKTSLLGGPQRECSKLPLRAQSLVIPSPASAVGLRPTWRPGKLTGQTQAPRDRTFPAQGPGTSRENSEDILRRCRSLEPGQSSQAKLWTKGQIYSPTTYSFILQIHFKQMLYSIKGRSKHRSIYSFSEWMCRYQI